MSVSRLTNDRPHPYKGEREEEQVMNERQQTNEWHLNAIKGNERKNKYMNERQQTNEWPTSPL